jgi:hypothetical protein
MPAAIRTLGPIHFEDIEPHRFEDLIRQLLWDFRPWRELETTGRAGADDGFDARGWEIVVSTDLTSDSDDDDESNRPEESIPQPARLWLIQCKRERAIGPTKLKKYLNEISESDRRELHGLVFAAACDFSKKAHDVFHSEMREFGIQEGYLWGKGEIEDMLFQPKNDRLLFAYTGISLQVRRRTLKTEIRSKLAMKRKATRLLEPSSEILLRDPTDERYPRMDKCKENRFDRGRWLVVKLDGFYHDGLHFETIRADAVIEDDGVHWDYAETANNARPGPGFDPWETRTLEEWIDARTEVQTVFDNLDARNQARFELIHILPYENILDIDENGDDIFDRPHIYTVPFDRHVGPFLKGAYESLHTIQGERRDADPSGETRVKRFPRLEPIIRDTSD